VRNGPLLEPIPQDGVVARHDDDEVNPALGEEVAAVVIEDDTALGQLILVIPSREERLERV
jgi:hypothetical protein